MKYVNVKVLPAKGWVKAIVDDEDYPLVSQYKWKMLPGEQPFTQVRYPNGRRRPVSMARMILSTPPGMLTLNVNKNRLDNRRSNLKIMSRSEWAARIARPKLLYPYAYRVSQNRWMAAKRINGKMRYLGCFESMVQASEYVQHLLREKEELWV
jgi:hypothetical protein